LSSSLIWFSSPSFSIWYSTSLSFIFEPIQLSSHLSSSLYLIHISSSFFFSRIFVPSLFLSWIFDPSLESSMPNAGHGGSQKRKTTPNFTQRAGGSTPGGRPASLLQQYDFTLAPAVQVPATQPPQVAVKELFQSSTTKRVDPPPRSEEVHYNPPPQEPLHLVPPMSPNPNTKAHSYPSSQGNNFQEGAPPMLSKLQEDLAWALNDILMVPGREMWTTVLSPITRPKTEWYVLFLNLILVFYCHLSLYVVFSCSIVKRSKLLCSVVLACSLVFAWYLVYTWLDYVLLFSLTLMCSLTILCMLALLCCLALLWNIVKNCVLCVRLLSCVLFLCCHLSSSVVFSCFIVQKKAKRVVLCCVYILLSCVLLLCCHLSSYVLF